jgi:formamidopyrimidine-DNA glycosylase
MPELPEVETIKRGLKRLLVGQEILSIERNWHKSFPIESNRSNKFLIGAKISDIHRIGKMLVIELYPAFSIIIHLKMTGQLVYVPNNLSDIGDMNRFGGGHPTDSLIGKLPDKSTRVILTLSKGILYFNDQRKFGWMKLYKTKSLLNTAMISNLGPDALDASLTRGEFVNRIRKRSKSKIKVVLLDQSTIAGVGNIYADESLWASKIHPETIVEKLSDLELRCLQFELIKVLNLAIEKGGSTDKNYVNADGEKGSYLTYARVFRRTGMPCSECGWTISKIKVNGRGTHICLKCQKL